jgi:hypothetical protein
VLPAGATPGGRQSQHPPAVTLGAPEPEPTLRHAIQTPVQRPEETDEPPWWKSCCSPMFVRHDTSLSPVVPTRRSWRSTAQCAPLPPVRSRACASARFAQVI